MTRRLLMIGAAALLGTASLAHAGDRERKILKTLLFPPLPVPVGGKIIDLNSVFRSGKVKSYRVPKVRIPVPSVRVRPQVVVPPPKVRVRVRRPQREVKPLVRVYFSTERPPRDACECPPRRPTVKHEWVSGYWALYGDKWTWNHGRWVERPTAGASWQSGNWQATCHGWQWMPGYWEYPSARRYHHRH